MPQTFTQAEVIRQLKKAAKSEGSQAALASTAGCSPQFLTDVLKSRRMPSDGLLAYLGLERNKAMFVAKGRSAETRRTA